MATVQLVRSLLLVLEMFGLESCATLEAVQMVSNLQTLGVPVRLASTPVTVSALSGIFLIPALGVLMDRCASSKASKAKILVFVSSLVLSGVSLILIGNVSKLYLAPPPPSSIAAHNDSNSGTTPHSNNSFHHDVRTVLPQQPPSPPHHPPAPPPQLPRFAPSRHVRYPTLMAAQTFWLQGKHHDYHNYHRYHDYDYDNNDYADDYTGSDQHHHRHGGGRHREGSASIPFYAILAMVGYALLDCGFDSSNCFLKTFAIACTSPEHHADVIVKCVFMSSIGGSFFCIMGLLGVGERMVEASHLDPNSADTAALSTLCVVITCVCLVTTLVTGMCWPEASGPWKNLDEEAVDEDTSLLPPRGGGGGPIIGRPRASTLTSNRYVDSSLVDSSFEAVCYISADHRRRGRSSSHGNPHIRGNNKHQHHHGSFDVRRYSKYDDPADGDVEKTRPRSSSTSVECIQTDVMSSIGGLHLSAAEDSQPQAVEDGQQIDKPVAAPASASTESLENHGAASSSSSSSSPRRKLSLGDFAREQKQQILINVSQFFLIGALYAFEIYCTNFVSIRIYSGDPNAPVDSVEYSRFMKGVQIGTAGVLTYYVSFTIFTFIVGIVLSRVGCMNLIRLSVSGQVFICLCLAVFALEWLYFVASVWMGLFRAVINTVPFILANQLSREKNGDKSTGVAIAVVSAMLPMAFALCSAIMGPLIHLTGNAGVPIYYAAASGILGLLAFAFYK